MTSAAWDGPGQMALRFEIARQIGSGSAGLFKPDSAERGRPAGVPADPERALFHGLRQTLGPATLRSARAGDLAAGLEHAVPVVARIHALTLRGERT